MPPTEPELRLVRRWLDSWRGVGDVVTGMNRQGYWLHLSNVDAGTWRATFSRDAMIAADGFGADPTPVAGGAAGGVGGSEEGRKTMTLSRIALLSVAYLVLVWYPWREVE